jgi:hypothetical protein
MPTLYALVNRGHGRMPVKSCHIGAFRELQII